ncbi:MAG: metal-sensitive transcriptional regulator [Caulobacter sp.]|jgi:DNA-binding FrmR family transcriptional regulator
MHRAGKPQLTNRLKRVEGQVRGIQKMVEDDRYCIDILTQLQAVRAALGKVEAELLREHMDHCVAGAFASGDTGEQRRKIDEVLQVLERSRR